MKRTLNALEYQKISFLIKLCKGVKPILSQSIFLFDVYVLCIRQGHKNNGLLQLYYFRFCFTKRNFGYEYLECQPSWPYRD